MRTFTNQTTDDAFEGTVDDFHHHAFTDHRTRVIRELAFDERANAVDFVLGNRRGLPFEGNDADDAGALQDRQSLTRVETRKAVAGKQRPVDLLLSIFPAAPARNGRQEGFDPFLFELLAYDLLVT